jgi:hypothetical protein
MSELQQSSHKLINLDTVNSTSKSKYNEASKIAKLQPSSRKLINLDTVNSTSKSKYKVAFIPQPFYKNICTIIKPVAFNCDSEVKSECGQSQGTDQIKNNIF